MFKLLSANRNLRNFALFSTFYGIGRGMFTMFMMWAVHAMFQTPMYTGLAGLMFSVPLIASFIVGPFVDKWNKVSVLRVVEFVKLCMTSLILVGHFFFDVGAWFYLTAILIFSIASLFGTPAQTALLPRIIEGENIVKANAIIQMTGIVGGLSIGVVLYVLMQRGADFALVYAVNVAVVIFTLLFTVFMRSGESESDSPALKSYASDLKKGFAFVCKGAMLPVAFFMVSLTLFSEAAHVNFPMFAEVHLGTATGYILLSALAMLGSVVGSWIIGITASKFELWKIIVATFAFAGVARIIFVSTIANNVTIAILIYILYTGLVSTIVILYRSLVQKLPPKNLVSRVDTIIASLSAIAGALGALVGGFLGTHLHNIDYVFFIQGSSYIVIGILLCISKNIRQLPKITELGNDDDSDQDTTGG